MERQVINGLKSNLRSDLNNRIVEHRNRFLTIMRGRYRELLPSLIEYENIKETGIDQLLLERGLRQGYNMVIGLNTNNNIVILGYTNKKVNDELFTNTIIRKKDINFIIPKHLQLDKYQEITNFNNCSNGNFIILRNKDINYTNDYIIIDHYTQELSEIVLSRFSLSMQAKINTFFIGRYNDLSIEQLVTQLYNGSPYISVNKFFDPKEDIFTLDNSNIGLLFSELKREYQNKISELNNMLGINSLAVEKNSGVSDTEAKGNTAYTTSNANIYLSSRQKELDKLNKRFNLNLTCYYNDNVKSEIERLGGDNEI